MRSAATFATLASAKVYFQDTFENADKWTKSEWKGDSEMGDMEIAKGKWTKDDGDTSLTTNTDARFYGMSASFDSFSNKDKTLIVQYQAKYDKDIECGGGYVKLGPKMDDPKKFGDPTAYNIMFGPDKCGYTKRTHLIFTNKGKNVLKKVDLPYKQETEGVSNLYRLTVSPDSKVKVEIDQEEVYSGKMEEDWELLEPKEIDDPDDKKPEDWVDDAMMDDPKAEKPADWVDEEKIKDPDAKKPDDWDEEEDGEWEAPEITNPEFKGEWKAERVSNPDYKGVWAPKKIANPDYEANDKLYLYEDFSFIGFDLWQVKSGSVFDNVIITDDAAEADKMAAKWKEQKDYETAQKEDEDEKKKDESKDAAKDAEEDAEDKKDDDDKDEDSDKDDDEDL